MVRRQYSGPRLAVLAVILVSSTAAAQTPAAGTAQPSAGAHGTTSIGLGASADTSAGATTQSNVAASGNAVAPAPAAQAQGDSCREVTPCTDHDKVVGSLGVGLLGSLQVRNLQPGSFADAPLNIAIIGARYWLTDQFGLQVGAGFNTISGTLKDDIPGNVDVETPTLWGVGGHVGVPISIYDDKHYNFLIIPEANLGYSTGRTKDNPNLGGDQGIEQSAWLVGVGAKIGAEVQFGFIDIPMLSLQGTIGAQLNYRWAETESVETAGGNRVVTRAKWSLQGETLSYDDPWDLFTSSIAALYYF